MFVYSTRAHPRVYVFDDLCCARRYSKGGICMSSAFWGLLGGVLVNIMPGAKRKQGLETLNVEQHRPPIAYIISYGILFIAFIGLPIYFWIRYGLTVEAYIISVVMVSPAGFIFVAHCHNYYHCFTETGIRWRNWRRKVRYFDYHSIYKVSYEQTSKNGWVKIRSTQLPKRIKLGFDTNQFDATILYAQLQYRVETGDWVQVWEDERFQQILASRPGVRFLQDHAWVKPLEFPRENG